MNHNYYGDVTQPLISIIYLQNTTSVVGNTTLLVLELLFEVSSLINTLYRFAVIQLLFKYQQKSLPFCELITLSLCDNNNCYNLLYRHETSNLDVTEEIFTLLTINNLNDVESSGLIDFSLILGSLIHSYLSGSLGVSNIWYRAAFTNLFLF